MKRNVCYFFYHHFYMSSAEREEIIKRIESHDYDAFIQFYNWYQINKLNNPDGWVYFPQYINMADDDGNNCRYCILDREIFNMITRAECECG